MTMVRKGNGEKEPFDDDKIKKSIMKAAVDAGYSTDDIEQEANKIKNSITEMALQKKEINTEAIKDHILKELYKTNPSIAQSWLKFDEKYKM
ncbi:MAG: transcriptional regulator [Methanobacterium sp.]|jgi:transcriptional repressor NrdR|nr:transcriptional regulator [Methanobacterium sp.]